jgi:soluble lytic murein transglycosylase
MQGITSMMICKSKFQILKYLLLLVMLPLPVFGMKNSLEQYFKYKSEGQAESATKVLNNWEPKGNEEKTYKKYFIAVNENSIKLYWDLYQELAKRKKLLKLQHESVKKIIEIDLESTTDQTKSLKNFPKVAKKMLKNLRGQPEGVEYELSYLKWIIKKKQNHELCTTERNRWLSQSALNLDQVMNGLESCPLSYNDFLYRMRLLIYSGEEEKAQQEVRAFAEKSKMAEWEKSYLEAVFYSNVGDPVSAFQKISKYEKDLRKSEDYYLNLFYIAQRAGEQAKAEEIINNIIKDEGSAKRLNELKFQKAFLFYQTKRYSEAIAILDKLIPAHKSYNKKAKSAEFDDLTWLRAWCHYLNKNYEMAEFYLKENAKWTRDKAKNMYWLAQTEWALGNQMVALDRYRELALPVLTGRYFNYYNHLAWLRFEAYKKVAVNDIMKSQISTIRLGKGQFLLPDVSSKPEDLLNTYQSYVDAFESPETEGVNLVNQENSVLESNDTEGIKVNSSEALKAELAWADTLTKWGYRDLAKWHLYEVEKNLKTKSDVIPLAQYYLDKQFYNRAIQLMQRVGNVSSKKLSLQDEEVLWKSLFPRAFESQIRSEAEKQKINKYLVWSIMKAETQFKTDAISPVGAVGLMQFMPYTSKKVAVLLKDDFKADKLFDPDFAIKYGAGYLKKLSDELGEQINLVAAGYNGGPHRVKLWLRNFKNSGDLELDNDVFIEHIPFNETRTYVKRVINFYLAYQKLYDEKFDLKSSQWLISKNQYSLKEPISLKEEWPANAQ